MIKLREKLDQNKLLPIYLFSKLRIYKERVRLSLYPDSNLNKYDGLTDKEYFLTEELNLSETYQLIFRVDLKDFGYIVDGYEELWREKDDGGLGKLHFQIDKVDYRERKVRLNGSLFGNSEDLDSKAAADIEIFGLKAADLTDLKLYQELLLEGYLLEIEKSYRMAFFSYFTAIEAYVSETLESIKENLFPELHEPLENLQLDHKVRIIARDSLKTNDLNSIKFWGEFAGLLRDLKNKRNNIAHGKSKEVISIEVVNDCFACLLVLISFSEYGKKTLEEIRQLAYPKII